MAILIDEPRWPAHGRLWAHLVSDTSLPELWAFADAQGLPARSFDLDHHDVPDERWHDLVAAGAQPVGRAELVRRLRASGLRVVGAERPTRERLHAQWAATVPEAPRIGHEILGCWTAPGRVYHGLGHLGAVLEHLSILADGGEEVPRAVTVAAWFHDAVYDGQTPADEMASAQLAARMLDGVLPPIEVAEIERLILLTVDHAPEPDDRAGHALCDADLGILGAAPQDYLHYTQQVRQEYAAVPEADFRVGRAAVLRRILERPAIYRTPTARHRWQQRARDNLATELTALTA